jgi:hypothetical protein
MAPQVSSSDTKPSIPSSNLKRKRNLPPPPKIPNKPSKTYKVTKEYTPFSRFPGAKTRRLRDITRKFQHHSAGRIPADVREELEREAQALIRDVAVSEAEDRRRAVMRMTKGPRFFGGL